MSYAKVDGDYSPWRGVIRPVVKGTVTPVRKVDAEGDAGGTFASPLVIAITRELADAPVACRDHPDLFAKAEDKRGNGAAVEEAKAVCFGCPFRKRCLDLALAFGPSTGVWGGYTHNDIARMRRGISPRWAYDRTRNDRTRRYDYYKFGK